MATKKLVNDPQKVVDEMIEGIVSIHRNMKSLGSKYNVIVRSDCRDEQTLKHVAIISGGGSGHEPAHAGFVGKGMLSASVLGNVFSSPTSSQVLAAIKAVTGPAGCLLIVKNYTGDKLNFGVAAEMARCEGYKVEIVIVGDDCALMQGQSVQSDISHARRGIAGTVFVHKLAGAVATSGASLEEVTAVARRAAQSVFSMGIGLSGCTIPAVGTPNFILPPSEVELGLGIHGEPGQKRISLQSADHHVAQLLDCILATMKAFQSTGTEVAVLVNNLGNTTSMELYIVAKSVLSQLKQRGYTVRLALCGPIMTALDMQGFSISILNLGDNANSWQSHLVAATEAPAWPSLANLPLNYSDDNVLHIDSIAEDVTVDYSSHQQDPQWAVMESLLKKIISVIISHADYLTKLDSAVGDGDLGINLAAAANTLLTKLEQHQIPLHNMSETFSTLGYFLQSALGGSSGPLYSIFFLRMGATLIETKVINAMNFSLAWKNGINGIETLGGAKQGDRTMLDALIPAQAKFQQLLEQHHNTKSALEQAAIAAEDGVQATSTMIARKGRSQQLAERALGHVDPGAKAVSILLQTVCDFFSCMK